MPRKTKPVSRQKKPAAECRAGSPNPAKRPKPVAYPEREEPSFDPTDGILSESPDVPALSKVEGLQPSKLAYRDDARGIFLYHGDCLEVMDHLEAAANRYEDAAACGQGLWPWASWEDPATQRAFAAREFRVKAALAIRSARDHEALAVEELEQALNELEAPAAP